MTCGQLATNGAPFITYLVVHCTPAIGAERHFRFMLDTTMTALRNTHHSRTNRQYFSRLYVRAFQQCNFLRTFFSLLLLILPIITNKEIVKEQHTRKNSIFHSVCRGPQTQIKCCRLWPRRCRCRRHDSNRQIKGKIDTLLVCVSRQDNENFALRTAFVSSMRILCFEPPAECDTVDFSALQRHKESAAALRHFKYSLFRQWNFSFCCFFFERTHAALRWQSEFCLRRICATLWVNARDAHADRIALP